MFLSLSGRCEIGSGTSRGQRPLVHLPVCFPSRCAPRLRRYRKSAKHPILRHIGGRIRSTSHLAVRNSRRPRWEELHV